jgi:hypothetical protein
MPPGASARSGGAPPRGSGQAVMGVAFGGARYLEGGHILLLIWALYSVLEQ